MERRTMLARAGDRTRALAMRLSDERGQTLGEYGILITVIAIVVLALALVLGSSISSFFNQAANLF